MSKKKNYNKKHSVNPAKNNINTQKEKKTSLTDSSILSENKTNVLTKPDPSDKEATRAYYENLSKAKVQKGFKKLNAEPKPLRNNEVKKKHVKENALVKTYSNSRSSLNKELTRTNYKNFIVGGFALVIIIAMVAVPIVSIAGWYSFGLY